jgi:hypothetical protein
MTGTRWDGFLVLLFGFLASAGIACCLKTWILGLDTTLSLFWFADGFFFSLLGVTGYIVCMIRFVNYLKER